MRVENGKILVTKTVEVDPARLRSKLDGILDKRRALRLKMQTHLDYDAQLAAEAAEIVSFLREAGVEAADVADPGPLPTTARPRRP